MTPQEIDLGTRFELELLNRQGEKVGNTFVSQLLEHQADGSMVISSPIHEARLVFIPMDVHIRLTFIHVKHGLLGFTAVVTFREHRGNIAILVVRPDNEIIRIQRRMHYRLDMVGNVLLWLDEESEPIKAYSKNISGSGLCLATEINIPVDTVIKAKLELPGLPVFSVACRVLRSRLVESKRGKQFEVGLSFMEIAKKDQDTLIRYIFMQQRLLLKREN
ncbi:MAG TPA: PilZ domain-containing protein [Clostridia bacterium]|nr:PilZ domain-containing protein [Clostridia bacterium]